MSRAVIRISTLCMKCVYLFIYETPEFQGTSLCLCSMVVSRQGTWTRTPVGDYYCMYSYSLKQCIYCLNRRVGYWFGVIDIFTRNLKFTLRVSAIVLGKYVIIGANKHVFFSIVRYLQAVKLTILTFRWGSFDSGKQKRHLKGYSGVTLIHGLNHHETLLDSLSRDQISRPLIYWVLSTSETTAQQQYIAVNGSKYKPPLKSHK